MKDQISKSLLAYFLHRIVSMIADITEDKNKRDEVRLMHNEIYIFLEKPKI